MLIVALALLVVYSMRLSTKSTEANLRLVKWGRRNTALLLISLTGYVKKSRRYLQTRLSLVLHIVQNRKLRLNKQWLESAVEERSLNLEMNRRIQESEREETLYIRHNASRSMYAYVSGKHGLGETAYVPYSPNLSKRT